MKVMVLGDSSALGKGMANTSRRWPVVATEVVHQRTGADIELIETPYFAINQAAVAHASRKVAAADPDIVIIIVGTAGIILRSVSARVEDLFGRRAKKWATSVEHWAERRSKGGDISTGFRGSMFRSARWLAHHTIGTAPLATADEIFLAYRDTFAMLARRENTEVICVSWNSAESRARQAAENLPRTSFDRTYDSRPDLVSVRDKLQARIVEEIEARHFDLLCFADYKQRTGQLDLPELGDSVRIADNGHEVFAEMMVEILVDRVAVYSR